MTNLLRRVYFVTYGIVKKDWSDRGNVGTEMEIATEGETENKARDSGGHGLGETEVNGQEGGGRK